MEAFMSKKRLLNAAEGRVMEEAAANLAAVGRLAAEYRNPTRQTARHIRGLVLDVEEELTGLVKGNFRFGKRGEEAANG
jgi:hypothetical protein